MGDPRMDSTLQARLPYKAPMRRGGRDCADESRQTPAGRRHGRHAGRAAPAAEGRCCGRAGSTRLGTAGGRKLPRRVRGSLPHRAPGSAGAGHPTVAYTRGSDLSGTLEGAGGIGGLLARTVHSGSSPYQPSSHAYYHADGNGHVTYLLNQARTHDASYRYDPYGRLVASSGPLSSANLLRFSSKPWHDPSETYYYGYRFYLPEAQRWVNRDPMQENGGLNLCAFNKNNAVNNVDLLGLRWSNPFGPPMSTGGMREMPPWQRRSVDVEHDCGGCKSKTCNYERHGVYGLSPAFLPGMCKTSITVDCDTICPSNPATSGNALHEECFGELENPSEWESGINYISRW